MPRTSEMKESNFLSKADVGKGLLLTITGCIHKNVRKEGAEPEQKWCLTFAESDKPLVLNWTNTQMCEQIYGSDNTDDWVGHQIVVYFEPNVIYGGKMTGGLRVRKPKIKAAPQAAPVIHQPITPAPVEEIFEDDVPF